MGVVLGGLQGGRALILVGHMVGLLATPWRINWRSETGGGRAVRGLRCDSVWNGKVTVQVDRGDWFGSMVDWRRGGEEGGGRKQ